MSGSRGSEVDAPRRSVTRRIIVEGDENDDLWVMWPSGRVTVHETEDEVDREIEAQGRRIANRWNALVVNVVEWRSFCDPQQHR